MKKQKKANQMLQHFNNISLSPLAQSQLRGGCGCGETGGGGETPPPPPKPKTTTTATGSQAIPESWGS